MSFVGQSFLGNTVGIHTPDLSYEEMDYATRRTLAPLSGVVIEEVSKLPDPGSWKIDYSYNNVIGTTKL